MRKCCSNLKEHATEIITMKKGKKEKEKNHTKKEKKFIQKIKIFATNAKKNLLKAKVIKRFVITAIIQENIEVLCIVSII